MSVDSKLQALKMHLNQLYGSGAFTDKTPMYIDNRNKNVMEEIAMNNYIMPSYEVQKRIYESLCEGDKQEPEKEYNENWIWVTGYKGLDKDMKARGDFQYEMDKLYIMPDGEPVEVCRSGYHMCLDLKDVFSYKDLGSGNRYFECKALVRERDLKKYGTIVHSFVYGGKIDKLAAKSIHLTRELTIDEILAHIEGASEWPEYIKKMAINVSPPEARKEMKVYTMIEMGYAESLARYIVNDRNGDDGYKLAVALDSQPGISMDTKINAIFSHI